MKYLFLILFLPLNIFSFINIESLRQNSNEGLNTSFKAKFNSQTGNTDKILASVSSLNSYVSGKNEYILTGSLRYGESFDEKDTEDGSVHLRYKRNIYRRHNFETYTQFEYNKFKALNFREVFGVGYRHEDKYFNTGVGTFFEHEEIDLRPNQDAMRANLYVSGTRRTQSGFEFSTILYAQPSLKRSNDLRVILNTGISQKINNFLNVNIEYSCCNG